MIAQYAISKSALVTLYVAVEEVEQDLQCTICHEMLYNPIRGSCLYLFYYESADASDAARGGVACPNIFCVPCSSCRCKNTGPQLSQQVDIATGATYRTQLHSRHRPQREAHTSEAGVSIT